MSNAGGNAFSSGIGRPPFTEQRGLEMAIAPNDINQNVIISAVYELPFGPGKRFANRTGVAGKVMGGWQIAAIARYFTGRAIGIGGGPSLPLFGGSNRPNRVATVPVQTNISNFDPNKDKYLNHGAFSAPANFTRGDLSPRMPAARSFATYQEDFTLFKFIPIHESVRLEFRMESYNFFNRAMFGGPSSGWDSAASFGNVGGTAIPPKTATDGLEIALLNKAVKVGKALKNRRSFGTAVLFWNFKP